MDVILNIGLAREGNSNIGQGTVLREVIASFGAAAVTFKHSDTEVTAVCCVEGFNPGHLRQQVEFLARLLGQDCIAVYEPKLGAGQLIGPRAEKWGTFNPEFFIMPDGSRLAQPVAQAA